MQVTDTGTPTGSRTRHQDLRSHNAVHLIALIFTNLMIASILAFDVTTGIAAVTALGVFAVLGAAYAIAQPILRWLELHLD